MRKLTLEEREVPLEKGKLELFEKRLDDCLGGFSDDTAQLLEDGVLPKNDELYVGCDEWDLEEQEDEHVAAPTEDERAEDNTLLSAEVIFPSASGVLVEAV